MYLRYTLNNGKFIIQAAPLSCCLPDSICDTFTDCEQPDPRNYYQKGCFSVIADTIHLIAFTRYLFYAVIVIQVKLFSIKYINYYHMGCQKRTDNIYKIKKH